MSCRMEQGADDGHSRWRPLGCRGPSELLRSSLQGAGDSAKGENKPTRGPELQRKGHAPERRSQAAKSRAFQGAEDRPEARGGELRHGRRTGRRERGGNAAGGVRCRHAAPPGGAILQPRTLSKSCPERARPLAPGPVSPERSP